MKVLSLLQPWATLVVMGVKQIETRSWSTTHRGSLLIHASKGKAGETIACEPPFKKYIPDFKQLPLGHIIGKVTLADIIKIDTGMLFHTNNEITNKFAEEEKVFGDYTPGRFIWVLQNPVIFKTPLEAKGRLAIWEFDERLIEESLD